MEFRIGELTDNLTVYSYGSDPCEGSPTSRGLSAKRVFDVVAASICLVFVLPLLLIAALAMHLQDGEKVLCSQLCWGRNGETFRCLKLRTTLPGTAERLQTVLASDPGARRGWDLTQKLTNDPRITPLGRFIRATSIDELPQLMNILRGDMSLVGPRPISLNERFRYGEYFGDYTRVRPGLTGLWQTSGRSNTTYAERVQLDKRYVQTRTFWGDVWIILKTVPVVFLSVGAK